MTLLTFHFFSHFAQLKILHRQVFQEFRKYLGQYSFFCDFHALCKMEWHHKHILALKGNQTQLTKRKVEIRACVSSIWNNMDDRTGIQKKKTLKMHIRFDDNLIVWHWKSRRQIIANRKWFTWALQFDDIIKVCAHTPDIGRKMRAAENWSEPSNMIN